MREPPAEVFWERKYSVRVRCIFFLQIPRVNWPKAKGAEPPTTPTCEARLRRFEFFWLCCKGKILKDFNINP